MISNGDQDVERIHCVVTGLVQGVGFRAFVVSNAHALGLTGWVKNLPDGRAVELVAEGESERLTRLSQALWSGPRAARVMDVQVTRQVASRSFDGFAVRE